MRGGGEKDEAAVFKGVLKKNKSGPGPKKQITLRIDPDVLTFFRKHGRGYQTVINAILRKYMEARKERAV